MANITIDGKPYTVKDGITIIEAIDQTQGSKIPRYCYHPGLSIAGNCRICQVEVEKMPRTVIACNTRVMEGMVIHTASAKAKESQQVVLEFLLANHPLDCPVCDQAGECKLQDYYMDYGLYDSKLDDEKVKKTKKAVAVGPTIMLDQERCILCTRCVRFGDEITKTHDFAVFNRGNHSELDIYPGKELNNKYSGNVADICPVGALTDRDFRFKMRVWYLGSQESVCPGCSRGCNTFVHYEKSRPYKSNKGRIMRLKPRENQAVNQWWMCDEGRYAYKFIDENRISEVRVGGQKSDWQSALTKVVEYIKKSGSQKGALMASAQYSNEDLYFTKKLFIDQLKWNHVAFVSSKDEGFEDNFLIKKDKNPNSNGASAILNIPEANKNITTIVEAIKKGEVKGLYVYHHDLAKILGAAEFAQLRSKLEWLVYEGWTENETAKAADVVLPSATYAEKNGTFTNFEGRVQRFKKVVEPMGSSLPAWRIIQEISERLGTKYAADREEHIFEDLAKTNLKFKGMDYKALGKSGMVWGV